MKLSSNMNTVFHPTDFSLASETAFRHALRLAYALRGKLTIMHVGDDDENDWSQFPHVRRTLVQWRLVEADILPADLKRRTGLSVEKIRATDSDPVAAMARYLERHEVDLMVMATHGRTGLAALQKPSVARALARKAKVPTMFVREGARRLVGHDGILHLGKVLVAVDSNPDPQMAIDAASRFEKLLQTPIGVMEALHISDKPLSPPLGPPHLLGGVFRSEHQPGVPEKMIPQVAQQRECDLIVMAYAGPQKMSERMVGSTTEKVVLAADCPVLAIPAVS